MKPTKSGLYEIWGGCLIEGDMVTPTRIHTFFVGVYPTIESVTIAIDSIDLEYSEIRYPKNYILRLQKLEVLKRSKAINSNNESVPF